MRNAVRMVDDVCCTEYGVKKTLMRDVRVRVPSRLGSTGT